MFSNLLTWLHDENNRAIVGMIGGAFALLWTAGWAVLVWWQEKKKEEDEQPARTASHERQRKPKPVKQGWSVFLRTSILAWAIGIVFLAAIWFAWLSPEKVVTMEGFRTLASMTPRSALAGKPARAFLFRTALLNYCIGWRRSIHG